MRKKFLFVIIVLLAAVLLSGCVGAVAWPGLAGDEQTAYLANGQFVYAINSSDGRERWHYPLQPDSKLTFYATPVVTPEGLVIIGSSGINHSLIAINPQKFPDTLPEQVGWLEGILCNIGLASCPQPLEVEEWIFTEAKDSWLAAPLALDDKLFAPNSDGNLYVLDLRNGSLIEKVTLDVDSSNRPNRLWAQPITDGERIFVTSLDHSIYALDIETHEIVWQEGLGGAIPGGAVLASDGMLYAGSLSKQLERFDPVTGAHEPVLDTQGWIWGTPVSEGDNLYFSDVEGYFYSYNTIEQKLNWEPVKPDSAITASPLTQSEQVLLATESGNVYAVDHTGEVVLWYDEPTEGKAYTTPVFSDGHVLIAYLESDYFLLALNEDGRLAWTFPSQQ
ncbi:MAG TPA: PQQ-binding-like beta-propeller repeat protein [Anaerolineales bacterium]|nr:PQQ-binding-like beta-propeller repeat protein [Anaerolineales bacterium]